MEINLKSLKLPLNQQRDFHFEEPGDPELLDGWGGGFKEPVVVDVLLANKGDSYSVQGKINTLVELNCSRCLKPFTYTVDTRFTAILLEAGFGNESAQAEEDVIFYSDGIADLTPLVEEVIITDIPMTPWCNEDCKGLCPTCGGDLNVSTCNCREESIDPRWEKLKQFT